jgi:hypothetical protein
MMTPFPPKTPLQMRREAEQRGQPVKRARKPGPVDPTAYPQLAAETPREQDATADWLAHIAAGRVAVR